MRSRSVERHARSVNRNSIAFPFSAVFVSSAGAASMKGRCTQHLLRLGLRIAKGERRRRSQPRNSFVPSCRPPHGQRRRRSASVRCSLGGGAAPQENAWRAAGPRVDLPSSVTAAGPVADDREARCVRRRTLTSQSVRARSRRLDLAVWLVHARSGYAAMNFSSEKTVSCDSM